MKNIISFPRVIESGNTYLKDFYSSIADEYVLLRDYRPSFLWCFKNRKRIDIVHFHWLTLGSSSILFSLPRFLGQVTFLLFLKSVLNKRIIFTLHNLYPHDCGFPRLEKFQRKIFLSNSDLIFIHQEGVRDEIAREFSFRKSSKIHCIPHGSYAVGPKIASIEEIEYNNTILRKGKAIDILFFGVIRKDKGILDFIDHFKASKQANLRLIIAGEPIDKVVDEILRAKTSGVENIFLFPDSIPDAAVSDFFNFADYVVLPFKNVTTSGSLMLALSYGVPVITSDNSFTRHILKDEFGWIYRNIEELESIMGLLETTHLKQKKKIHNEFDMKYSWKKVGAQIKIILQHNLY